VDVRTEGGRRRVDRILAPGFLEGLDSLEMDEVRSRRNLVRAEREYLSFLRRLLQGRMDILRAERDRRRGSGSGSVLDRLPEILAEGTRGPGRGEAPIVPVPEEEISLARRRVERLASDASLSDPQELSDQQLEEALGRLGTEERDVSDVRARVIAAHDALQGEVKRRYRAEVERQEP
jgi:hypothetical protein